MNSDTSTTARAVRRPAVAGREWLRDSVDIHIHACPHINQRSVDVFDAVRMAADAGMRAIGLMDNFCNTAGYAALANRHLGHLGVEVFGGLIMEPAAGGVNADSARAALDYGYGGVADGARFISLPTHHTAYIARLENRSASYIEQCLQIPLSGGLPDPLPEILDLVAARDVVLNTGHLSGEEAVRLVEHARAAGVDRILTPCSHYEPATIKALTSLGAVAEFSFFFITHATQVGLTHVDEAKHTIDSVSLPQMAQRVRAAEPSRAILSSDCGVFLLPPPVEGLREFILSLEAAGLEAERLRTMIMQTPRALFKIAESELQN